jgi:hypothetical protein
VQLRSDPGMMGVRVPLDRVAPLAMKAMRQALARIYN